MASCPVKHSALKIESTTFSGVPTFLIFSALYFLTCSWKLRWSSWAARRCYAITFSSLTSKGSFIRELSRSSFDSNLRYSIFCDLSRRFKLIQPLSTPMEPTTDDRSTNTLSPFLVHIWAAPQYQCSAGSSHPKLQNPPRRYTTECDGFWRSEAAYSK